MKNYDDIINLPHHVSKKHPKMPIGDRASQFASFSALTGHADAIKEEARLTDCKEELTEYQMAELSARLNILNEETDSLPLVKLTYFVADKRKSGGKYVSYTGNLRRLDQFNRCLIFTDGKEIPIDDIMEIN